MGQLNGLGACHKLMVECLVTHLRIVREVQDRAGVALYSPK